MNGTFKEQDLLHDLLVLEKDIVKNYGGYIVEASCSKLRNTLHGNLKAQSQDQFTVYKEMSTRGYYPSKDAPKADVDQAKTKFGDMLNQMS